MNKIDLDDCPIALAQKILGGKWALRILYNLSTGILRFGELNRQMPELTQATLTKELRRLESFQLINRKVYPEVPPRVEYSLAEMGLKLLPVLRELEIWGDEYKKNTLNNN
ncbi:winged helix-turn-helix transcriptional regulator [Paenibacillus terreus]|uniref:Winged helix-turn-helix transcriptional regulator n=1 Tax=Paenibacillus terreus TaxID=1387834 RepID=A0ABV5BFP7_9BACL